MSADSKNKKKIRYSNFIKKDTEKSDRLIFNEASVKRGRRNPRKSLGIKTGDDVLIISGDEKGKIGKVLKVFPRLEKGKVIVEGINIQKKHSKRPGEEKGQIIEREGKISRSKVSLYYTGEDGVKRPTRIKKENNKRVAVKTGKPID